MVTQEAAERLLDTPRLRSDMTHLSKALGRWILHTNRLDITHQTLTHDKREKNQKVLIKDCIMIKGGHDQNIKRGPCTCTRSRK